MANEEKFYSKCTGCGGDGLVAELRMSPGAPDQWTNRQCLMCAGAGYIESGALSSTLITLLQDMSSRLDDVMDKCNDIFEKVSE